MRVISLTALAITLVACLVAAIGNSTHAQPPEPDKPKKGILERLDALEAENTAMKAQIEKLRSEQLHIDRIPIYVTSDKDIKAAACTFPAKGSYANYNFVAGVSGTEKENNDRAAANTMRVRSAGETDYYKCKGKIVEVLVIPKGTYQSLAKIHGVTVTPSREREGELHITALTTGENVGGWKSVEFEILVLYRSR